MYFPPDSLHGTSKASTILRPASSNPPINLSPPSSGENQENAAPRAQESRDPPVETIEATLSEIFDFYATRPFTRSRESVLKAVKFHKMILDADLIDESPPFNTSSSSSSHPSSSRRGSSATTLQQPEGLTSARVDLIFKKLCGNNRCMTFDQFIFCGMNFTAFNFG